MSGSKYERSSMNYHLTLRVTAPRTRHSLKGCARFCVCDERYPQTWNTIPAAWLTKQLVYYGLHFNQ